MKLFEETGKVIANLSWLLGFVRRILESVGITNEEELVKWLKTEAGKKEAEASARSLVMNFLEAQQVAHTEEVTKPNPKVYLRDLYENEVIELGPDDGTRMLADSKDTFKAGVDGDFVVWGLNKKRTPRGKIKVRVCEMVEDGMFTQIFGSVLEVLLKDDANLNERKRFIEENRENLKRLCIGQGQFEEFAVKHRGKFRKDGYGTFALLEKEDTGEFFVASADFYSGDRLDVSVYRLECGSVWFAEYRHRFVIPQLA